jgi:hypothetical protein
VFEAGTPIPGVTNGSAAAAGQVGEYLTASANVTGGMYGQTNGTVVSLALTAGDWDVWAVMGVTPIMASATAWVWFTARIAGVQGTMDTKASFTFLQGELVQQDVVVPHQRASSASSFIVSAQLSYPNVGVGLPLRGWIAARRVR